MANNIEILLFIKMALVCAVADNAAVQTVANRLPQARTLVQSNAGALSAQVHIHTLNIRAYCILYACAHRRWLAHAVRR